MICDMLIHGHLVKAGIEAVTVVCLANHESKNSQISFWGLCQRGWGGGGDRKPSLLPKSGGDELTAVSVSSSSPDLGRNVRRQIA